MCDYVIQLDCSGQRLSTVKVDWAVLVSNEDSCEECW